MNMGLRIRLEPFFFLGFRVWHIGGLGLKGLGIQAGGMGSDLQFGCLGSILFQSVAPND